MTKELSPETMLAEIIEAQVKGGCDTFETSSDVRICIHLERSDVGEVLFRVPGMTMHGSAVVQRHVLQILLDPSGLRAAYGEKYPDTYVEISFEGQCECRCHTADPFWAYAAIAISRSWLSKPEGDALAAIKTAHSLLPKA